MAKNKNSNIPFMLPPLEVSGGNSFLQNPVQRLFIRQRLVRA
jgi:hypothetical protein